MDSCAEQSGLIESQSLEEFKALKADLLFYLRIWTQLQALLVVGPAGLFGLTLSLESPNPLLYLSPVLLIVPIMIQIGFLIRQMIDLNVYISTFIEPSCLGFKYVGRKLRRDQIFRATSPVQYRVRGFLRFEVLVSFGQISMGLYFAWRDWVMEMWQYRVVFAVTVSLTVAATVWMVQTYGYRLLQLDRWRRVGVYEGSLPPGVGDGGDPVADAEISPSVE